MIVLSIGPVQSFIASARKIEDLWAGSFILSDLIYDALYFLQNEPSFEPIFPYISRAGGKKERDEVAEFPNRFTGFYYGSRKDAEILLQKVAFQIRKNFKQLCLKSLENVFPQDHQNEKLIHTVQNQVDRLLEIYWAIYPAGQNYQEDSRNLESRLNALKNVRPVQSFYERGPACTVCSEREALSIEPFSDSETIGDMREKLRKTWARRGKEFRSSQRDENEEERKSPGRIRDGEYLCAVCLGKRVALQHYGFKRFQSVVDIAGEKGYYAILLMDGDNMGEKFAKETADEVRELSRQLSAFSREVKEIISQKKGKHRLVYAGGDDVLAFLELEQALTIANEIRKKFKEKLPGATASGALVFAPKKAPLQVLLEDARRLEKEAKGYVHPQSKQEKNALALCVRTTADKKEAVIPWDAANKEVAHLLNGIRQKLQADVSDTFIYHLSQSFGPLITDRPDQKLDQNMLSAELYRLINRSLKRKVNRSEVVSLLKSLLDLHEAVSSTAAFISLLKIVTFFKRKETSGRKGGSTA